MDTLTGYKKELYMSIFLDILEEYPIIFSRSMLPDVSHKKSYAFSSIRKKCEMLLRDYITEKQLRAKLLKMKTRLRSKLNLKRTGNTAIKLNSWEHRLFALMESNSNCGINTNEGARNCSDENDDNRDEPSTSVNSSPAPPPAAACQSSSPLVMPIQSEAVETKELPDCELLRLVPLQQHSVLKEERDYFEEVLERFTGNAIPGDDVKVEDCLKDVKFVAVKHESERENEEVEDCLKDVKFVAVKHESERENEEITIKEESLEDAKNSESISEHYKEEESCSGKKLAESSVLSRPYSCTLCSKSYVHPSVLKMHFEKNHSGTDPSTKLYSCSVCSKPYHHPNSLISHIQNSHMEKYYKCAFCSASFTEYPGLNEHWKEHERECIPCHSCTK